MLGAGSSGCVHSIESGGGEDVRTILVFLGVTGDRHRGVLCVCVGEGAA